MSLFSVFRYVAIVHPIRAHILCSRKRIVIAISVIWPLALLLGLPTVLFNQVRRPHEEFPFKLCMLSFPSNNHEYKLAYKAAEFLIFFLGPVVTQSILYSIICKQLFVGTKELYRRPAVSKTEGVREKDSDAIRARKGVVKMLIASVMVYFFSYAPAQLPLIYVISGKPFNHNWSFLVLVMTLGYVNSAANPILYCIFSQNFRRSFKRALCLLQRKNKPGRGSPTGDTSMGPRGVIRFGSLRGQQTATTALMSEALTQGQTDDEVRKNTIF